MGEHCIKFSNPNVKAKKSRYEQNNIYLFFTFGIWANINHPICFLQSTHWNSYEQGLFIKYRQALRLWIQLEIEHKTQSMKAHFKWDTAIHA